MGQAKQRGSREQRIAKAVEQANVFIPHSADYRRLLEASIIEATHLGLDPLPKLDAYKSVSDDILDKVRVLCNTDYVHRLNRLIPGYWGTSCQTLSTHLFAWLRLAGYDADLVVGEVSIHGNLEYDATLQNIRNEYITRPTEGLQQLHMWITLGDDTIVDPGLAHRLIKYYRVPGNALYPIVVERADQLGTNFGVHHQPMLVGADFAAKTNSVNPFSLLDEYASRLAKIRSEPISDRTNNA